MALAAPPLNVGDVISGRYRVQSWIGQGHMAVVYEAVHEGTGKLCAIKFVHAHLVTRPDIVELFLKEAKVGGRIGHSPYIVDVFDASVDEARRVPYLAMELLQGEALDHYLHARGPMPAATVKVLYQQLGEALDQAHAAGVVHRDLKPANLFLTQNRKGEPVLKVVDFGIAKVLELEAQRTATQIGSPAYAAPEQLGQALRKLAAKSGITIAGVVSAASDVWAIGLIAYELLTGLVAGQFWGPFDSLGDLVTRVVLEDPLPATTRAGDRANLLPRGFDQWLSRCLAKDASLRWATAGEAATALVRLIDGEGDIGRTVRLSADELAAMGASALSASDAQANDPQQAQAPEPFRASQPAPADVAPIETTAVLPDAVPDALPLPPPLPQIPQMPQRISDLSELAPLPGRSLSSLPPDTSAAGTKVQPSGERSWIGAVVFASLAILIVAVIVGFVFLPRKGGLRIDIASTGGAAVDHAEVFVDGQKQCDTTPCVARDLKPGPKSIKVVTEDGRAAGPVQAIVTSGEDSLVTVTLPPLAVAKPSDSAPKSPETAPPESASSPSAAPSSSPSAELAMGPSHPTASPAPESPSKPPVATTERAIAESPRSTSTSAPSRSAEPAAPAASATLNVNSIPVSKVVLDGRALGSTPKIGLSVEAGSHSVTVIHPTLGKRTIPVTLKAGETKTVSVKLE